MSNELSNPVFQDADKARVWLEAHLWPDGPICPQCGTVGNATALATRQGWHQCNAKECRSQFTVTVGTLFERSHIPLNKWLMVAFLICASKKGISTHQLHRMIGVSYKSTWFMMHRLREAMREGKFPGPLGGKGKIVEADETYVGGRYDKRRKRETHEKTCVMGVIQRGGQVRAQKIRSRGARAIAEFVKASVEPGAKLMTDQYAGYKNVGRLYEHSTVNHSHLEYVAGLTHTNSIENFWSLFKRGLVGSFHQISEKHLDRYLNEFCFRFNARNDHDLFGVTVKNLLAGKALPYETLTQ